MNQKVYRREQKDWAKNAEFYRTEAESPFKKMLCAEMQEKFLLTKKHQKILDLGAGAGDFANYLTKALGSKVICCDFSQAMKKMASKKYPQLPYQIAPTTKLPFEAGSFDVVIAAGLLHHLKAQEILEESLAEIKRVLRPGGYFCYLDRSPAKIATLAESVFAFIKKIFVNIKGNYSSCSTSSETLLNKADIRMIASYFKSVNQQPAYCLPFKTLLVSSYFLLYTLGKPAFYAFQIVFFPFAWLFEKYLNFGFWETEYCGVSKKV